MNIQTKRERKKAMVTKMIAIYCRGNHGTKKGLLCPECEALTRYACERSDKCPFMETKTFCSNCKGQMKDYWGIGYNLHYDYWHKEYCTEAM